MSDFHTIATLEATSSREDHYILVSSLEHAFLQEKAFLRCRDRRIHSQ